MTNPGAGSYGPALNELELQATFETASRVHFKLIDPNNTRYEIPETVLPYPQEGTKQFPTSGQEGAYSYIDTLYTVDIAPVGQTFTLTVIRNSDEVAIFDLADLEYSNQFLQFSNVLPQDGTGAPNLYGLGEHVMTFQLPTNSHSFTLWNVDIPTPYDQNIYGSHPFYLQTLTTGQAHGLFLRNSNGMDIITSTTKVTFKAIGGILDWYIFTGPLHELVIQQYHQVIGLPHFPPYWSEHTHTRALDLT